MLAPCPTCDLPLPTADGWCEPCEAWAPPSDEGWRPPLMARAGGFKTAFLAVSGAALMVLSASADVSDDPRWGEPTAGLLAVAAVAAAMFIAGGVLLAAAAHRHLDHRPVVTVADQGVYDRRLDGGPIRWAEVTAVALKGGHEADGADARLRLKLVDGSVAEVTLGGLNQLPSDIAAEAAERHRRQRSGGP